MKKSFLFILCIFTVCAAHGKKFKGIYVAGTVGWADMQIPAQSTLTFNGQRIPLGVSPKNGGVGGVGIGYMSPFYSFGFFGAELQLLTDVLGGKSFTSSGFVYARTKSGIGLFRAGVHLGGIIAKRFSMSVFLGGGRRVKEIEIPLNNKSTNNFLSLGGSITFSATQKFYLRLSYMLDTYESVSFIGPKAITIENQAGTLQNKYTIKPRSQSASFSLIYLI